MSRKKPAWKPVDGATKVLLFEASPDDPVEEVAVAMFEKHRETNTVVKCQVGKIELIASQAGVTPYITD